MHSNSQKPCPLLRLPTELKEEIFSYLLLPRTTYRTSPTTDPKKPMKPSPEPTSPAEKRGNAGVPDWLFMGPQQHAPYTADDIPGDFHIDTCIWLPCRLPKVVFWVCKQLREDCLAYYVHHLNFSRHPTIRDPVPLTLADYVSSLEKDRMFDEYVEQYQDDGEGYVRVTLEFFRQWRSAHDFFMIDRQNISPQFMALTPVFNRLRKIKFIVWFGYAKSINRQWSSDMVLSSHPGKTIGALLEHLPLLEEVKIDLFLREVNYWNWKRPNAWWSEVKDWFERPMPLVPGGRLKRIARKVIEVGDNGTNDSWTVFSQCDSLQ